MPESSDTFDPLAPHSLAPVELQRVLAAEQLGHAFLAYRDGNGGLELFALQARDRPYTVGRREEMDLALDWDREVSGIHAELELLGSEVTIVDDGLSTNGTYVNGKRVVGRARLRNGDRLRLGRTSMTFRRAEQSKAMTTVAAAYGPGAMKLTEMQQNVLVALCRPMRDGAAYATPATNQEIADQVFLSVDAVKMHLRNLFAKFELVDLPQNQKRARLAEYALQLGVVTPRDMA